MVVAVIAADGRSGNYFVREALASGFKVRAGVRNKKLLETSPNLTVITCDALRENDVANLCQGADVLVSLIGHSKNSAKDLQTRAIQNAIAACQATGIKRIISLTGTGVRAPKDKPSLIDKILNFVVTKVDPERVKDGIDHAEVLSTSDLDWTILRVLKLQNTKQRPFQLTTGGPARIITSRQDVATAIVKLIRDKSYIKQLPIISN